MQLNNQNKAQIIEKVNAIIKNCFTGEKAEYKLFNDRLNFACPYCGDSYTDHHKKRGNLYFSNLFYHCFNCSKHVNFVSFIKDNKQTIGNLNDLSFYLDYIRNNQKIKTDKSYLEPTVFTKLNEYSIPLDVIKRKLKLVSPVENNKIKEYLKERFMHKQMHKFLYNEHKQQLYIFNFNNVNNVISWQIRNFKEGYVKYVSYNIEKINHLILNRSINTTEDEIAKMNSLSLYFGIFQLDFTKNITIFEGAIDSFFINNSISVAGADRSTEMFDNISTIRFLFDNDLKGRKIMEDKLKSKKAVFMWKKMIDDFKIQPKIANMKEVKDFSDLISYCWITKNDAIKNIDNYFTQNLLDIGYV